MPAGCKKGSFPTQYKNDLSLFCELGVFHADCMSGFLKTEKKTSSHLKLGRIKSLCPLYN